MAKLEVSLLVGEESKRWLSNIEALITKLEKLTGSAVKAAALDTEDDEASDVDDDEDFASKAKTKKTATVKAKSFEDDEETEDEEPAPRKRAKKLTVDDVNDACKEYAREMGGGKDGKLEVLKILKKKFKTDTVTELEPDQYAAVIAAMQA